MHRNIALIFGLLLLSSFCYGENDIWNALFREKLSEANRGDSEAQYDVGTMYQNGRGVQADRGQALQWYQKAAAQNNPRAISRLKLMEENASRFSRTQSQAGKGDRESLYELGNMYMMGVGADIDNSKAIQAFEKSANLGNNKAAYKLGLIYYEGTGVRSNPGVALKWFRLAATGGVPAAQYYLGKMYAEGKGVRRDNHAALKWLSKAVDGGYDQARGEMINVTENINMQKSVAATAPAAPVPAPRDRTPPATASKTVKAAAERPGSPAYQLTDLMQGAWSRADDPVPYLPSAVNNCRTESGKVICFSDEETRKSGSNLVRFKTKAIIENFSKEGSFSVTYRNLVINATPLAGTDVSGPDGSSTDSYQVKTGWGTPHVLECNFKDNDKLSCVKNNTHTFELTSSHAVASRR